MKKNRLSVCILGFLALHLQVFGAYAQNECTPDNRALDKQACLDKIAENFVSKDLFWFGSWYDVNCPSEKQHLFECLTVLPYLAGGYNLSSLIFKGVTDGVDQLNTYVDVKYQSEQGSYDGCNSTFEVPETEFTLDPLTNELFEPFFARDMPEITYEYTADTQYALLVLDVAIGPVHGLYLNIPGDDFESDKVTAINPYFGPGSAFEHGNVYVFLLFEQQTKDIELDDTTVQNILDPFNLNKDWNQIFNDLNFTGPIGINWLHAGYDPSTTERVYSEWGIAMNCAIFVEQALVDEDRPFIPDDVSLSVFMTVEVQSEELKIRYCCENTTYEAKTLLADPLSDDIETAGDLRGKGNTENSLTISVVMNKANFNTTTDFVGLKYTAICVDPDIPADRSDAGTEERPLLQMAAINGVVEDGVVQFEEVLVEYVGLTPADPEPHTYYFLLYEQTEGDVDIDDTSAYVGTGCSARITDKCLFDVEKFTTDNSLDLVAVSWVTVENDDYVNNRGNSPQVEQCQNRPTYTCTCDPSCAEPSSGDKSYLSLQLVVLIVAVYALMGLP